MVLDDFVVSKKRKNETEEKKSKAKKVKVHEAKQKICDTSEDENVFVVQPKVGDKKKTEKCLDVYDDEIVAAQIITSTVDDVPELDTGNVIEGCDLSSTQNDESTSLKKGMITNKESAVVEYLEESFKSMLIVLVDEKVVLSEDDESLSLEDCSQDTIPAQEGNIVELAESTPSTSFSTANSLLAPSTVDYQIKAATQIKRSYPSNSSTFQTPIRRLGLSRSFKRSTPLHTNIRINSNL